MGWVKIDDAFFTHRKVEGLTKDAKLLFIAGLTWCARGLTDGFISTTGLRTSAALVDVKPTAAKDLVDAGLWHKRADGHDVHDYLKYQPPAEEERQRRREHADRMKQWRESKKPPGKPPRDGARDMSHGPSPDEPQGPPRDSDSDSVSDALPDPVVPSSRLSPSHRLKLHPGGVEANGGEGKDQGKAQVKATSDPFVERIVARMGGKARHRPKAEALVARWRTILDQRLIDQAIGMCEGVEEAIFDVAYFEAALERTAGQYDVRVPPMPAESPRLA
jgi:hypothetical protein